MKLDNFYCEDFTYNLLLGLFLWVKDRDYKKMKVEWVIDDKKEEKKQKIEEELKGIKKELSNISDNILLVAEEIKYSV